MGKVSFATKDQSAGGLGFDSGWGEIVEIEARVHQFEPNKTTGQQGDPAPMIRMMIQRTDAEGNATDEDPIEQFLGCGSLEKFHPGIMSDRNDEDPQDAGSDLDVSGNCLYSVDGARLNNQSRWAMFCGSMEAKGVKPEILQNGFLPDLIGMKALFETVKLPKREGDTKEGNSFRVAKITTFPTGKGSGGGGKAATGKKDAGKAAAAKGTVNKKDAAADTGADDQISEFANTTLSTFKGTKAGQTLSLAKLKANAVTVFAKQKFPSNTHKAVNALLTDPAWLESACEELGIGFDADAGELTFPEAE